jgi:hypothetical protein
MTRLFPLAAAAALSTALAAGAAAAQEAPTAPGTAGEGPTGPGMMPGMMGEAPMGPGMMGDGPMGPGMMGGHGMGGHGSRGIDFAAVDTDGNGVLSRDELRARAVARFGQADGNGDGALDRSELIEVLARPGAVFRHVFSADPAEGQADRLLALVGATETGQVEVVVLADRRVNMLLAMTDSDRDAAISQAEAAALAARLDGWRGHHGHRDGERGDRSDR